MRDLINYWLDVFAIQNFSRTIGILPFAIFALPQFGALDVADGVNTCAWFVLQFRSVALEPCWQHDHLYYRQCCRQDARWEQNQVESVDLFNAASVITGKLIAMSSFET